MPVEAMACGTPVIGHNVGGVHESVTLVGGGVTADLEHEHRLERPAAAGDRPRPGRLPPAHARVLAHALHRPAAGLGRRGALTPTGCRRIRAAAAAGGGAAGAPGATGAPGAPGPPGARRRRRPRRNRDADAQLRPRRRRPAPPARPRWAPAPRRARQRLDDRDDQHPDARARGVRDDVEHARRAPVEQQPLRSSRSPTVTTIAIGRIR